MSQTVIGNTTYHDLNVNTLGQTKAFGKPDSMMKCITDVVKQHLYTAMKSIGAGKAKDCYRAIEGELEAPQQQEQPALAGGEQDWIRV